MRALRFPLAVLFVWATLFLGKGALGCGFFSQKPVCPPSSPRCYEEDPLTPLSGASDALSDRVDAP